MILLWMLACGPRGGLAPTDQPGDVGDDPALIQELTWECDTDGASWLLEASTDAWSAGAYVWVAETDSIWERHTARSVEAARDGSSDLLRTELSIESDWREANSDGRTRFRCEEVDDLAWQITVYDRAGDAPTDCLRWGAEGIFEQIEEVADCEARWEGQVNGGEVGDSG